MEDSVCLVAEPFDSNHGAPVEKHCFSASRVLCLSFLKCQDFLDMSRHHFKVSRKSRLSSCHFLNCQDWESRSRPGRDRSRLPGLIKLPAVEAHFLFVIHLFIQIYIRLILQNKFRDICTCLRKDFQIIYFFTWCISLKTLIKSLRASFKYENTKVIFFVEVNPF
jgi:hypothetical protein